MGCAGWGEAVDKEHSDSPIHPSLLPLEKAAGLLPSLWVLLREGGTWLHRGRVREERSWRVSPSIASRLCWSGCPTASGAQQAAAEIQASL